MLVFIELYYVPATFTYIKPFKLPIIHNASYLHQDCHVPPKKRNSGTLKFLCRSCYISPVHTKFALCALGPWHIRVMHYTHYSENESSLSFRLLNIRPHEVFFLFLWHHGEVKHLWFLLATLLAQGSDICPWILVSSGSKKVTILHSNLPIFIQLG